MRSPERNHTIYELPFYHEMQYLQADPYKPQHHYQAAGTEPALYVRVMWLIQISWPQK